MLVRDAKVFHPRVGGGARSFDGGKRRHDVVGRNRYDVGRKRRIGLAAWTGFPEEETLPRAKNITAPTWFIVGTTDTINEPVIVSEIATDQKSGALTKVMSAGY